MPTPEEIRAATAAIRESRSPLEIATLERGIQRTTGNSAMRSVVQPYGINRIGSAWARAGRVTLKRCIVWRAPDTRTEH